MPYTIGDTVIYNDSRNYFEVHFMRKGVVSRVSPTGRITLENGMVFGTDGQQRKSAGHSYPVATIVDKEVYDRMVAERAKKDKHAQSISALLAAINGRRCGNGSYNLTDDMAVALDAAVVALTKN